MLQSEYDSDEIEIAAYLFLLMNEEEETVKKKWKRKYWVKP